MPCACSNSIEVTNSCCKKCEMRPNLTWEAKIGKHSSGLANSFQYQQSWLLVSRCVTAIAFEAGQRMVQNWKRRDWKTSNHWIHCSPSGVLTIKVVRTCRAVSSGAALSETYEPLPMEIHASTMTPRNDGKETWSLQELLSNSGPDLFHSSLWRYHHPDTVVHHSVDCEKAADCLRVSKHVHKKNIHIDQGTFARQYHSAKQLRERHIQLCICKYLLQKDAEYGGTMHFWKTWSSFIDLHRDMTAHAVHCFKKAEHIIFVVSPLVHIVPSVLHSGGFRLYDTILHPIREVLGRKIVKMCPSSYFAYLYTFLYERFNSEETLLREKQMNS